MNLETFETCVRPQTLERARSYYREGRVGEVEEIAPQLFHAAVDGTNLYDVDVRIKGNGVASAACTCPYDGEGPCKHIAATLMVIRATRRKTEESLGDVSREADGFPHETYDAVMAYLNDKGKQEPGKSSRERAKRSDGQSAPNLDAASSMMLNGLSLFWEPSYEDWDDIEFDSSDFSGLEKTLDRIETTGDIAQACLLALLGIETLLAFVQNHHEPDCQAEELLGSYRTALQNSCDDLSNQGHPELKRVILNMLIGATRDKLITDWCEEMTLVYAAIPLCDKWEGCGELLARIDEIADDKGYEKDSSALAHYRLLKSVGRDKDAEKYRNANRFLGPFLRQYIDEAFLRHDMLTARSLLEKGLCLEPQPKKAKRKPAQWRGYDRDVFPNGFLTYLEAVYEELEDREALLDLYRRYLLNGHGGGKTDHLDKLRSLSADDWPDERKKLVEENLAAPRPGGFFTRLLREEHLTDAALRYCKAKPERVLELYRLVGADYPEETKRLLLEVLESMLRTTSSRTVYRDACSVVQKYQSLFGTSEALHIANELEDRYSKRKALKEELEALKKSWT